MRETRNVMGGLKIMLRKTSFDLLKGQTKDFVHLCGALAATNYESVEFYNLAGSTWASYSFNDSNSTKFWFIFEGEPKDALKRMRFINHNDTPRLY